MKAKHTNQHRLGLIKVNVAGVKGRREAEYRDFTQLVGPERSKSLLQDYRGAEEQG